MSQLSVKQSLELEQFAHGEKQLGGKNFSCRTEQTNSTLLVSRTSIIRCWVALATITSALPLSSVPATAGDKVCITVAGITVPGDVSSGHVMIIVLLLSSVNWYAPPSLETASSEQSAMSSFFRKKKFIDASYN
jgi:hypothetical protein